MSKLSLNYSSSKFPRKREIQCPILVLLLSTFYFSSYAQSTNIRSFTSQEFDHSVIAAAGSVNQTDKIMLEWTLGESFVENISGNEAWYTVGFHQAILQIKPNLSEEIVQDIGVKVFPNPFSNTIKIKLEREYFGAIKVCMTDLLGRSVLESKISETSMDVEIYCPNIPPGSYFLRLNDSHGNLLSSLILLKSN